MAKHNEAARECGDRWLFLLFGFGVGVWLPRGMELMRGEIGPRELLTLTGVEWMGLVSLALVPVVALILDAVREGDGSDRDSDERSLSVRESGES